MTTHRGVNPDWRRKKGKSFEPKYSSRQRGSKTVFDRAEELGYHSAFPTPAEAQAWIDAHEPKEAMNPLPLKHCVHCGEKKATPSGNGVCADCQKKYRGKSMKKVKEMTMREALGKGVCFKCGNGVQVFKSNESRGVYQRTGLCQTCQESKMIKECSFCSGPITKFRDTLSLIEHNISGMCQRCQDKTFGESKNYVLQSEVRKELIETVKLVKEAEGMHPEFEKAAQEWMKTVQNKLNDRYMKDGYANQTPSLSFDKGRVYWRVVANRPTGGGRYSYAFLDTRNGDVLKSAGWKAPAKGARGNIFHGGLGVGVYGGNYKRGGGGYDF